jgi:hypothetical protein
VIATAAVVGDLPPVLRWSLAVVAGGGLAGTVQGATVLARLKSGVTTGGLANPVVATGELLGSTVTSVLAIVLPLLAFVLVVALVLVVFAVTRRVLFGRNRARR